MWFVTNNLDLHSITRDTNIKVLRLQYRLEIIFNSCQFFFNLCNVFVRFDLVIYYTRQMCARNLLILFGTLNGSDLRYK